MSEEEKMKEVNNRLNQLSEAVKAANLEKVPHIMIAFTDDLEVAMVGSTRQFQNPFIRLMILAKIMQQEAGALRMQEQAMEDMKVAAFLQMFNKGPVS